MVVEDRHLVALFREAIKEQLARAKADGQWDCMMRLGRVLEYVSEAQKVLSGADVVKHEISDDTR